MRLAVFGLGKLGSVLAAVYAQAGHEVVGYDVDPNVVSKLNAHRAPFLEPGLQELIDEACERLAATTDPDAALCGAQMSYVIVPTPSGSDGSFANDYVLRALQTIGESLRGESERHTVVISSTVMPGSCDGDLSRTLEEASGRSIGQDVGLAYSPEFIALGSIVHDMHFPDIILIGASDPVSGDLVEANARSVVRSSPAIQRMSLVEAELVKLAINTFVTTKISFANMLGEFCDHLPGADVDIVTKAVGADSRIGSKYLRAGTGYGGPCFPRDNVALTSLGKRLGVDAAIPRATDLVNDRQVARLVEMVRAQVQPPANVAVLGLAYKPDTPVCDRSQGVMLANELSRLGFSVTAFDPIANAVAKLELAESVSIAEDACAAITVADAVVLTLALPGLTGISSSTWADKSIIDVWGVLDGDLETVRPGRPPGRGLGQ